ncbi:hypothetical protein C8J56DRAFT_426594 [Mycena floridula]|nr:hypothetical protein C8J56DRAFT_426594 [Mycena floridula]
MMLVKTVSSVLARLKGVYKRLVLLQKPTKTVESKSFATLKKLVIRFSCRMNSKGRHKQKKRGICCSRKSVVGCRRRRLVMFQPKDRLDRLENLLLALETKLHTSKLFPALFPALFQVKVQLLVGQHRLFPVDRYLQDKQISSRRLSDKSGKQRRKKELRSWPLSKLNEQQTLKTVTTEFGIWKTSLLKFVLIWRMRDSRERPKKLRYESGREQTLLSGTSR